MRKANKRLEKRDTESALAHLEKAVEISPQFMNAWNQLGTDRVPKQTVAKAEEYFRTALDLQADAFPPVVNLGAALLALSRHDEALRFNQYAVTLRSDDALANSQLGRNFFLLGNDREAIRYLTIASGSIPRTLVCRRLRWPTSIAGVANTARRSASWRTLSRSIRIHNRPRRPAKPSPELKKAGLRNSENQAGRD